MYICLVDGACSNNGKYEAEASGSFAIYETSYEVPADRLWDYTPIVHNKRFSIPLTGRQSTNNAAEAVALLTLIMELDRLGALGRHEILVYSDSQLTINQFYGVYRINNQALKKIHGQIKNALKGRTIKLAWISGETMKSTIINH